MANRQRGEVGVVIDGKSYVLRPTFDSLCELEDLVDKPIDEIFKVLQEGRRSGLRAVVWCLLQDRHADTIKSLKDASAWIDAAGGEDVAIALVNRVLLVNAEEAPGGGDTGNPPGAQSGSGEPSSSVLVGSV